MSKSESNPKTVKIFEGLDTQYEILTKVQETIADVITWLDSWDFVMIAGDLSSIRCDIQEVKNRIFEIKDTVGAVMIFEHETDDKEETEDVGDWMDKDTD